MVGTFRRAHAARVSVHNRIFHVLLGADAHADFYPCPFAFAPTLSEYHDGGLDNVPFDRGAPKILTPDHQDYGEADATPPSIAKLERLLHSTQRVGTPQRPHANM